MTPGRIRADRRRERAADRGRDEIAEGLVDLALIGQARPPIGGRRRRSRRTLPDDEPSSPPPRKASKPEPAPMQPPSAKSPSQPSIKKPATKKPATKPSEDPGKGGLKLNLGTRPDG